MKVLKKLIIPLVVLLLLVAGLVVYTIISSNPEPETVQTGSGSTNLIDGKKAVKLTVDSLAANRKIVISKMLKDGEDYYEVEGISLSEGQTFSQSRVGGFFESLSSFTAEPLASNADLAEYGLDKPLYSITVEMEEGESKTIQLGNDSFDGTSTYAVMKDSKDVYTVEIGKKTEAAKDPASLISNEVWDIPFKDVSAIVFKSRSQKIEFNVDLVYNDGTKKPDYVISSPYYVKAGKSLIDLINRVLDFEVTQYVDLTDDKIEKLGLKDPEYSFRLEHKFDEAKEIYLSAESDGNFYGYTSDDKSKYFFINKDLMKELELPEKSLINKSVISFDPSEVKSITVRNGTEDPFILELSVGYSDNLSSEGSRITLNKTNAKIITPEGRNFGSVLFESIVNVDIEGIEKTANPAFDSDFNIKIITTSYKQYNYDFVKRSDKTYYVFLNGEYTGFYVKSDELFKKESKDSYSYGIIGAYELLKQAIKDNEMGKYEIKPNSKPADTTDPTGTVDPDASVSVDETDVGSDDGDVETESTVNSEDLEMTEDTEETGFNG